MGLTYRIVYAACIVGLFFLSLFSLLARKSRRRKHWRDPFCEARMRPAGESLRLKLQDLDEEWTGGALWLVGAMAAPFTFVLTVPSSAMKTQGGLLVTSVLLTVCFVSILFFTVKMWKIQKRSWALSLGFDGERYVGQILTDSLVPLGCRVFHDLPFDGFNVDHLVVSPCGVFVVETKTYSKPVNLKTGKAEYKITYDGRSLVFPRKVRQGNELGQTSCITKKVAEWLSGETGTNVPVQAVLLFPGWFIEVTGNGPVVVTSPKYLVPRLFPNGVASVNNGTALDGKLFSRILYIVSQKAVIEESK